MLDQHFSVGRFAGFVHYTDVREIERGTVSHNKNMQVAYSYNRGLRLDEHVLTILQALRIIWMSEKCKEGPCLKNKIYQWPIDTVR